MIGLLIRHGHCDAVGVWLAGRREGVPLSDIGAREAEQLAQALRWAPFAAIYSSPLERARSTGAPLARDHHLPVITREALTDIDFGSWTGQSIAALATDPAWTAFNGDRSRACPPGGESLADVQRRVVAELLHLSRVHAGAVIAIVTHAELIRCAIAAFDGLSLDDVRDIEISPAHVTTVQVGQTLQRVLSVNLGPEVAQVRRVVGASV